MPRYRFKTELRRYFREYHERIMIDGVPYRSLFVGFKSDKFDSREQTPNPIKTDNWLELYSSQTSVFDEMFGGCKAQYSSDAGTPQKAWMRTDTTLKDLDPTLEHYVLVPEDYICIDFDLKGENGEKDLNRNLAAASAWPETYAEVSKVVEDYTSSTDTLVIAIPLPSIVRKWRSNVSAAKLVSEEGSPFTTGELLQIIRETSQQRPKR